MNRDFTLAKYEELCSAIVQSGYAVMSVKDYLSLSLSLQPREKIVILRHDVDRKPEKALKMAEIERELGIFGTYYFRSTKEVFKAKIMQEIEKMGHEVGYHYEVLDKAKGNYEKAIEIFEAELKEFRKICDVKTICMHGNPLSKWTNKDVWDKYDFNDFDIIGEPYLSIDFDRVAYFTDTGRSWGAERYRVKDNVDSNLNKKNKEVKHTDDIIKMIKKEEINQILILTHPQRWSDGFVEWVKELIGQNVKNVGKAILVRKS